MNRTDGSRKKRDQRDLLKKYQSANEKIQILQKLLETAENDALVKSEEVRLQFHLILILNSLINISFFVVM